MGLTREELLIAAEAADRYWPGWGHSFFMGHDIQVEEYAVEALERGECRLEDG